MKMLAATLLLTTMAFRATSGLAAIAVRTDRFLGDLSAMEHRKLLGAGLAGTVITALCCFTPVLVVLLGAVGLSAWLGWLDYVLAPALAIFVGITIYALYRQRQAKACCGVAPPAKRA